MNYRDLQNISNLSQQILVEGANEEHNVLNRWPYTSPYLQESTEVDEGYKDLGDKARDKGHQLLNKSKKTATRGNMYTGTLPSNTPEGENLKQRASQQFAVSAFHNPEKAQAKAAANKEKGEKKKKAFGNRLMRSDKQGIKDSYDLYDIILSHLLDEGYAETQEQAEAIMVNMSEEWRESICEGLKPRPEEKMQNKIRKNAQRWMKMHDIELGMPHARRLVDRNDKIRNNLFTPNSDRDAVYNKHRPEEGKRSKFISDNNAKKK
jgi:hypothetical protein